MIDGDHEGLSLSRQCVLLGLSRSALYYTPVGQSAETLTLMRRIDERYLRFPFYSSRRMARHLAREGVGRPPPGAPADALAGLGGDLPQAVILISFLRGVADPGGSASCDDLPVLTRAADPCNPCVMNNAPHRSGRVQAMGVSVEPLLDAGVHVMAEKPACAHPDRFERLAQAAERRGVHLMMAFAQRREPVKIDARRIIAGGGIGSLYAVQASP